MRVEIIPQGGPSRLLRAVALGVLVAACFAVPGVAQREGTLFAVVVGVCGLICATTYALGAWTGASIGGAVGLVAAVALSGGSSTPAPNHFMFLGIGGGLCAILGCLSGGLRSPSAGLSSVDSTSGGIASGTPPVSATDASVSLLREFELWCDALDRQSFPIDFSPVKELERFLVDALARALGVTDISVRASGSAPVGPRSANATHFTLVNSADGAAVAEVSMRGALSPGQSGLMHAVLQEMWARLAQFNKHRRSAAIDTATGALARREFVAIVGELAQRAEAELSQLSVAVLEIGDARRGAAAADWNAVEARMCAAAQVVRSRARKSDVVGRLDDTRLAIAVPRADGALTRRIAEKLAIEAGQQSRAAGGGGDVSIGVAECSAVRCRGGVVCAEDLLARAAREALPGGAPRGADQAETVAETVGAGAGRPA